MQIKIMLTSLKRATAILIEDIFTSLC